jgi:hypothetical protein
MRLLLDCGLVRRTLHVSTDMRELALGDEPGPKATLEPLRRKTRHRPRPPGVQDLSERTCARRKRMVHRAAEAYFVRCRRV